MKESSPSKESDGERFGLLLPVGGVDWTSGPEELVEQLLPDVSREIRQACPNLAIRRLFTALPEEEIASQGKMLGAGSSGIDHLLRFVVLEADEGLGRVLRRRRCTGEAVNFWDLVRQPRKLLTAQKEIFRARPKQNVDLYLKPAPVGIGAEYVRKFRGGDGAGMRFVDVEKGWDLSHADLANLSPSLIWGCNCIERSHGTAVLGIVAGRRLPTGGGGIAPGVAWVGISSSVTTGGYPDAANAVLAGASKLRPGDVLLLEAQTPVGQSGEAPADESPDVAAAVSWATRCGIVVIEAAGNANSGMAMKIERRSSGAIAVGAARSTKIASGTFRQYVDTVSNIGAGVKVFAPGIVPRAPSSDEWDYQSMGALLASDGGHKPFVGTSPAAAIIAGVALVLQGISRSHELKLMTPQELSGLLTRQDLGTPVRTSLGKTVGYIPDLRRVIAHLLRRC